jgi:hypothetical protein
MDAPILHALAWPTLGTAVLVFGFAPGAALRLILLLYRRDHPRRQELLGELYAVPRIERPFWVAQQLEIALFEGLSGRLAARRPSSVGKLDDTLMTRHDSAGHRVLGFAFGAAVVVVLVVLDAIPLNWAAQAFGLDSGGTWLVTVILVVASAGAMLGFELTREHPRRRVLLAAVVAVGYAGLLGLRTEFLTTAAAESVLVALLQSAMLAAISAGFVLCGAAVLARTRPLGLSRSRAATRRARQAAAEARAAQAQAMVRTPLAHCEVTEDVFFADHRGLRYAVGAALVGLLVMLDVIPLNWAAQAFGLDSGGTWLVTVILVVASVGAMLGFQLTRRDARRHGLLVSTVAAGYLALLMLRMEYLGTVFGEALLPAILQAVLLTAISAALVLCGSAVLARIAPRLTGEDDHVRG